MSTDVPVPAKRPPSLRSVASNASIGSSLSRRSRTRTRSKTSPRPDVSSFFPPISSPLPAAEPQVFADQLVAEPTEMVQEEEQAGPANQGAHIQFKPTPPSAFSRVPSIPQLYDLGGPGHTRKTRDSVLTQTSGFTQGSSSVYPPSTSTASGTESPPSPRSIMEPEDNNDVASYDPELDQEYDGDDVSYRLRLLVKNNYFLPPAHSKPSSSDFAATVNSKKAARPPPTPTTGFFDIFRKSRSKPSTPTGTAQTFDIYTPVLRTTSDSTTVSAYGHLPQTPRRSTSQVPGAAPDPSGRVVVVREKMYDIASAAKQAEHEMKSRGAARREDEFPGHSEVDVIDPTDVVDLPPPSAAYPFAVQASALHGMGVLDSVGAAQLADRLPPRSPGAVSVENDWRKALLHAAVNHSLSSPSVLSSPTQGNPVSPPLPRRMISHRIASPPPVEEIQSSAPSPRSRLDEANEPPRASSTLPTRVETPSMPLSPLAPPPRRLVNPLYSLSQTSLPLEEDTAPSRFSTQEPNSQSAPRLSDAYEAGVRNLMLSPPLRSRGSSEGSRRTSSDSYESFYSEEEPVADFPRPSISSSIPENRPSLSLHSQASPTTSAFQDAAYDIPSIRTSTVRQSLERPTFTAPSPIPRDSMVSPPPRVSSSLAHVTPLSPPPRSTSLGQRIPRALYVPPPLPSIPSGSQILDPGPSTPPFPITDRRGIKPLALEIPRTVVTPSIRSAPAPSSPPSFFDSIQNQPNAMDDLDSDSDDDDDDDLSPPQTPVFVDPRTRAVSNVPPSPSPSTTRSLLMRLGNHSTPYVTRSADGHSSASVSSKQAISNVPMPGAFFTERRGGKGKGRSETGHGGPPTSTFDFYQYAQQHPLMPTAGESSTTSQGLPRRPHTSEQTVKDWQSGQRTQESMRRLDGMLIQHMEAEKDAVRRMATTLQSNART
ncbi:hypothetical protein C8F04DRAFT_1395071 [Mycena alexandri]|uniref:Uncharacterized protein n=1 Tax=Mycena alexandri TaxID=1745969 RepID=A0AAD6T077_9AGAR|nr:hypothetical protein C8F04DRAFT_1395071 [Mycena alexandri]